MLCVQSAPRRSLIASARRRRRATGRRCTHRSTGAHRLCLREKAGTFRGELSVVSPQTHPCIFSPEPRAVGLHIRATGDAHVSALSGRRRCGLSARYLYRYCRDNNNYSADDRTQLHILSSIAAPPAIWDQSPIRHAPSIWPHSTPSSISTRRSAITASPTAAPLAALSNSVAT